MTTPVSVKEAGQELVKGSSDNSLLGRILDTIIRFSTPRFPLFFTIAKGIKDNKKGVIAPETAFKADDFFGILSDYSTFPEKLKHENLIETLTF
ncbi:MAG TPA: hypothetical protein DD381_07155 [Lentisphaeria bacterium]|nr:MAG: hypothetical protein A2X47_05780 [Lentisphaerae bacterium GWF2_38_69]HBM16099.1 hypothetical protein [Lentisphaeria bacterium]